MSARIEGQLVHSDTAGTGPAVNAETGQVTQPGEPLPAIEQAGGTPLPEPMPVVLANMRAAWLVLEAAGAHDLPLPFDAGANEAAEGIRLLFWTHDDVCTWAMAMEATVDYSPYPHAEGVSDIASAEGVWLDVKIRVAAHVLREVAS